MRLKRFSVKGFKNFQQEIVLEDMGTICVIHGENNVGKSNVLEAMQLFFQLLQKKDSVTLDQADFKASEIFTLGNQSPIIMSATFEHSEEQSEDNTISISLQKAHNGLKITKTIPQSQESLFKNFFENPFALIGVDRRISEKEIETERLMVPQTLLLKLYDAKDSLEPAIFEKWELFVRTMQRFNDVLGEGEFISIFNRHNNRANLVFQSNSKLRRRIPIEILGSGIQQVIALVARLLVSHATFVAIEEPELNLRYTLQMRLWEILHEIVKAPVGPQQIFLTSHSPAFEFGKHFYAMRASSDGPIIERRSTQEAGDFTQHYATLPTTDGEKPPYAMSQVKD
jgi:predicted ATP-dependent endonuclease of OLD family